MSIHWTFADADGRDITGTEAVAGYTFADYFSSDIEEMERLAEGDADTLNAWLQSAYIGPDIDGVGVVWRVA